MGSGFSLARIPMVEVTDVYLLNERTDKALRQPLLAFVEEIYVHYLHHRYAG